MGVKNVMGGGGLWGGGVVVGVWGFVGEWWVRGRCLLGAAGGLGVVIRVAFGGQKSGQGNSPLCFLGNLVVFPECESWELVAER